MSCYSLFTYFLSLYLFVMAKNYESEITQFLNQYKKQHPQTEQNQRQGRDRLWDKHIDPELENGYEAANTPQPPYVYYQND